MFLLTIFNPFLTRGLRSTGFEGVPTEICLIQQVQTKTDSMHADRVLADVSWMRGKCPKHECRPQQAGSASLLADPTLCLLRSLASKRLQARLKNPTVLHTRGRLLSATPFSKLRTEPYVSSFHSTSTPLSATADKKLLPFASLPLSRHTLSPGHTFPADLAGPIIRRGEEEDEALVSPPYEHKNSLLHLLTHR